MPRDEECLKYMFRLHLKVAGKDFHHHLKQVHLRPKMLVMLLRELIDRGRHVFEGSGPAEDLKERMKSTVANKYPDQEAGVPLEEQKGTIPPSILRELEEKQEERDEAKSGTGVSLDIAKNATSGDAARDLDTCLDDVRPKAFAMDRDGSACSTPDALRG